MDLDVLRAYLREERGLSPVLGETLMVAIAILVAAIATVSLLGLGNEKIELMRRIIEDLLGLVVPGLL